MVQTNNHLARAHMLHLRYLCCHYGLRGKSGISAAVNQWAASAPGCFEAVYLALLSLRANIEAESKCLVVEPEKSKISFSFPLNSQRRHTIDILCAYIEASAPVTIPFHRHGEGGKTLFIHLSDFIYPFCSARRCSCEHCVVAEEHHADYIAAHSLITSWATWKALAFLLGPLPKVVTPRRGNSKIYISMNSEYNNVISQYLVTDIHRKRSKCLAHGVVLPTAERPRGSICADSLQSYFQSSRLWWKQTMLHPHMFPFREISDEEPFLQRVKEKMVHQSSLPEISSIWTSLNWLSLLSQRIHDESDFSKIVSIETFGHNDKCSCQQVLLDKTCVHKVDSDGDVPCNFLLVELLCFQIIVSCHLHGGCQDNMFCVLGINHLLDLCRSTASTAEQVSDIFLVVQLLSSMRIDAARAAKLGALLPKLGISRNKLTSGE